MTDATAAVLRETIQPQHSTEAPCSANVRARIGGYDWQITCRSHVDKDDLLNMAKAIKWWNAWLDAEGAPASKAASDAINIEHTAVTAQTVPTAPVVPGVTGATVPTPGAQRVQCVMIEVGTSYTGGKTQLKFNCNGLEHPLTYTKAVGDMVKLLAPLGFTASHIVVGQKYPVNCFVTYHENTNDGKTYKNVDKVEAA